MTFDEAGHPVTTGPTVSSPAQTEGAPLTESTSQGNALVLPSTQFTWKLKPPIDISRGALELVLRLQGTQDAPRGARQYLFSVGGSSREAQCFIQLFVVRNLLHWRILVKPSDSAEIAPFFTLPLPEGDWAKVTCGWDLADGNVSFFLDEELKTTHVLSNPEKEALHAILSAHLADSITLGANARRRKDAPLPRVLLKSVRWFSQLPENLAHSPPQQATAADTRGGLLSEAWERYTQAGRDPRFMGLLPEPKGEVSGLGEGGGDFPLVPEGKMLVARKLPYADCRLVKAFVIQPIDGQNDSFHYSSLVSEYDHAGYSAPHWELATYEWTKEPAVHISLADKGGFNHLIVRGGFMGSIYTGVDTDDGPGKGKQIAQIREKAGPPVGSDHFAITRVHLPELVVEEKVSFFKKQGLLADVSFLRIGQAGIENRAPGSLVYFPGREMVAAPHLGRAFRALKAVEPEKNQYLSNFDRRFFRREDREISELQTKPGERPLHLSEKVQVHLLSPSLPKDFPLGKAQLKLRLKHPSPGTRVEAVIHDPLYGNHELLRFGFTLNASSTAICELDFPDHIAEEGSRFWLTLSASDELTLLPETEVVLIPEEPQKATEESIAQTLLRAAGIYSKIASARPWASHPLSSKWLEEYDGSDWALQRRRPLAYELFLLLERIETLQPGHPIAVGQYLTFMRNQHRGGMLDASELPEVSPPPGVPRWVLLLQRSLQATVGICNWWLTNRQSAEGEFGSFLGDDTDLLQWWVPLAMVDDSFAQRVRPAFAKLCDLLLKHNLKEGTSLRQTDPLHAYEEGLNHLSIMPLLFYGDPYYIELLMEAARTSEKYLQPGPDGTLRFAVSEFGYAIAQNPALSPPPGRPSVTSALMLHPQLILAWYNQNPRAVETLKAYAKGMGYHISGGFHNGESISFGLYWITGDKRYLGSLKTPEGKLNIRYARGTPALLIHNPSLPDEPGWAAYKSRFTNDILKGDLTWALLQDTALLERALEFCLWGSPGMLWGGVERFRYMMTEAEPVADRVYLPTPLLAQVILGGYSVRNRIWPSYAVSYTGFGDTVAPVVLEQGKTTLKVLLTNLSTTDAHGFLHPWQLGNGSYETTFSPANPATFQPTGEARKSIHPLHRMASIPVVVKAGASVLVHSRQVEAYDDLLARADLAISPRDIAPPSKGRLEVTVHNIGSRAVENFEVALLGRNHEVLATVQAGPLEAPLDLLPKTTRLSFPTHPEAAWVCIDPSGKIPEITRLNNRLPLPRGSR